MQITSHIIAIVAVYLGVGLPFALAFVMRGADRIDHTARGSSIGFRIIILPGVVALWPLMVMKWRRA